jgi:hypothetical protein
VFLRRALLRRKTKLNQTNNAVMAGITFLTTRNDLSLPRQAQSNYTLSRCFQQLMTDVPVSLLCLALLCTLCTPDESNILRFSQFANRPIIFVMSLTI